MVLAVVGIVMLVRFLSRKKAERLEFEIGPITTNRNDNNTYYHNDY